MRTGRRVSFPDGVAFPVSGEEVRELIRFARERSAALIPYGGGTSVLGQVTVAAGGPPTIAVDMGRMSRLLDLDLSSGLATFGAGVRGPDLEASLRARGLTLGHYPQSFEYSTLGGWIATRSTGQQALAYGRIEQLFAGGIVESPAGTLRLRAIPASAAGPDLRDLVLGSEGRLGIITEATVRVRRVPEHEQFHAIFFPHLEHGLAALQAMMHVRLNASMLRLSTAEETMTTFALARRSWTLDLLERWLALRGIAKERCLLLMGFTGTANQVHAPRMQGLALARSQGGVHVGRRIGAAWVRQRFRTPYLRNGLWDLGYAVDTLETAGPWSRIPAIIGAIEQALAHALEDSGEMVFAFTHLSHPYPDGSNVYTTLLYRLSPDPEESLERWRCLKVAASEAILAAGGTISHQHGVGTDHLPYLAAEKGALGVEVLRTVCRTLDPDGMMNPGKLL
jgi:alkyldihydroxyacetonephosphate synthase